MPIYCLLEHWRFHLAPIKRLRAAWMKVAACGRVDWVGHVAYQTNSRALEAGFRDWNC